MMFDFSVPSVVNSSRRGTSLSRQGSVPGPGARDELAFHDLRRIDEERIQPRHVFDRRHCRQAARQVDTDLWQQVRRHRTTAAQMECTLLAFWGEGHEEAWLILTDRTPECSDASWYGLRTYRAIL